MLLQRFIKQNIIRRICYPFARLLVKYIPTTRIIVKAIYNLLPAEQTLSVHNNLPFLVNIHDKGVGEYLFLKGNYAPGRIIEIQRVVRPGDKVIDIGANIGYFTILMANLVGPQGKVYAFEPDPRNFFILQQNIKRNKLTNVILEQKAVSNKNGEFPLYQTQSWSANTLVPREYISSVKVQIVTLDSFLSKESNISFIKMDTDGSEPFVILGMKKLIERSSYLKILTEYQPGNLKRYLSNPLDFIKIAKQNKLRLVAILDSNNGRLSGLDLTSLTRLSDNKNLDLLFTRF